MLTPCCTCVFCGCGWILVCLVLRSPLLRCHMSFLFNHPPSKLVWYGCIYTPLARLTLSLQQHHYRCRVRRLGAHCRCACGTACVHTTFSPMLVSCKHFFMTPASATAPTTCLLTSSYNRFGASRAGCGNTIIIYLHTTAQHATVPLCGCRSQPPLESPPATGTRSTMIMHYTVTPCSSPAQTM